MSDVLLWLVVGPLVLLLWAVVALFFLFVYGGLSGKFD